MFVSQEMMRFTRSFYLCYMLSLLACQFLCFYHHLFKAFLMPHKIPNLSAVVFKIPKLNHKLGPYWCTCNDFSKILYYICMCIYNCVLFRFWIIINTIMNHNFVLHYCRSSIWLNKTVKRSLLVYVLH